RNRKSIVYLDSKVANGAFNFRMPEQQLDRAQICCAPIDQRCLGPPQRVSAELQRIKTDVGNHSPTCRAHAKTRGRARCVSSARRDLCGGRGAILVPTVTLQGRSGSARIPSSLVQRKPHQQSAFSLPRPMACNSHRLVAGSETAPPCSHLRTPPSCRCLPTSYGLAWLVA